MVEQQVLWSLWVLCVTLPCMALLCIIIIREGKHIGEQSLKAQIAISLHAFTGLAYLLRDFPLA